MILIRIIIVQRVFLGLMHRIGSTQLLTTFHGIFIHSHGNPIPIQGGSKDEVQTARVDMSGHEEQYLHRNWNYIGTCSIDHESHGMDR